MRRVDVRVPVPLPNWLYTRLRHLKRRLAGARLTNGKQQNLIGDRDIEWSWVAARIPSGNGKALDFGPGLSHLPLIAAQRGFDVVAVDLDCVPRPYHHPRLKFIENDILSVSFPDASFDLVISSSTVEHVGLAGRYGVSISRPDGDLEAMARLRQFMKADALMLMTIPVGQDAVFAPLCRVYGQRRLPLLLKGYTVEEQTFWVKDSKNDWIECDRDSALRFQASAGSWDPLRSVYALGCFALRRPRL